MYNQEKDFARLIMEILGKDGKSISAVATELENRGIKMHRLIITGYLRALTDQGIVKERDIPPSKIYIPVRPVQETIYESVGKCCRKVTNDPDELILYTLHKLMKRPIFTSELKLAGVNRPIGREASQKEVQDSVRVLRRAGNTVSAQQTAVFPSKEFPEEYIAVLTELTLETRDTRHLVMETKQTTLHV